MPIKLKPRAGVPIDDPCALLALAKQAYYLMVSGGQTTVIDTPALGHVEFSEGKIGDLQRVIDGLERQCAAANGVTDYPRRRVISIEACP